VPIGARVAGGALGAGSGALVGGGLGRLVGGLAGQDPDELEPAEWIGRGAGALLGGAGGAYAPTFGASLAGALGGGKLVEQLGGERIENPNLRTLATLAGAFPGAIAGHRLMRLWSGED